MAILVNTETNTGLHLEDGYFRLTSIRIEERPDVRHPIPEDIAPGGYNAASGYDAINNAQNREIKHIVSFSGALYANQEARENGKLPLHSSYYSGHMEMSKEDKSANIYELVYLHITELAQNNSTAQKLFGNAKRV